MIPEILQDKLIKGLENHFSEFSFKNLQGELTKIKVFKQTLPPKKYEEEENTSFPCIIVELNSGEINAESEKQSCKVNFIIGTVISDNSANGQELDWQGKNVSSTFSVINKILYLIQNSGIIDKKFELQYPINWDIVEDETAPFSYGSVETSWLAPGIIRKDEETAQWL